MFFAVLAIFQTKQILGIIEIDFLNLLSYYLNICLIISVKYSTSITISLIFIGKHFKLRRVKNA